MDTTTLIQLIQNQIESVYAIASKEQAHKYLIDKSGVHELLNQDESTPIPKELFLVNPNPQTKTVEVALFLDQELTQNLSTHPPLESLNTKNLSDFCTLIEGISHFVYYLHKAELDHSVTQLEMELQAEIDKFMVLCVLIGTNPSIVQQVLGLLFEDFYLHEHLDQEQSERYLTASNLAQRYCHNLANRMLSQNLQGVFRDIRNFYPLSQEQKIRHILSP